MYTSSHKNNLVVLLSSESPVFLLRLYGAQLAQQFDLLAQENFGKLLKNMVFTCFHMVFSSILSPFAHSGRT